MMSVNLFWRDKNVELHFNSLFDENPCLIAWHDDEYDTLAIWEVVDDHYEMKSEVKDLFRKLDEQGVDFVDFINACVGFQRDCDSYYTLSKK